MITIVSNCRPHIRALCLAIFLCEPGTTLAAAFTNLPARVRAARGEFQPVTAADVARAEAELRLATTAVERFLTAGGANGRAWQEYLLWSKLTAPLAAGAAPDLEDLVAICQRATGNHAGLELPVMQRLRYALQRYIGRLRRVDNARTCAEFQQRLEALAASLVAYDGDPDVERLAEIGGQLAWLEEAEQVPSIVAAVRAPVLHPNFLMTMSQPFVTAVTTSRVDRHVPLTDHILGTSIRGTAHTTGGQALYPAASADTIALEARFSGHARTWGRGYNGPVRMELVGSSLLSASGSITFAREGFRLNGTASHADASGHASSMWTKYNNRFIDRLVTRVARKSAARQRVRSDCIASRHAEQQLNRRMGQEVQERLATAQASYLRDFRDPLLRRDAFPRVFQLRSTPEVVYLGTLLASSSQLGAPVPPPPTVEGAAVAVRVHETAVGNLAATLLAGATLSEKEMMDFVGRLSGRKGSEKPPATDTRDQDMLHMTFAETRPLVLRIDDRVVSFTARGRRFVKNQRAYSAMNITVHYRFERTPTGVSVTQVAEPEITPPRFETDGPGRLSAREVAGRRVIRNLLSRELKREYRIEEFVLAAPADRFGEMVITALTADDGWLAMSLCGVAEPAAVAMHRPDGEGERAASSAASGRRTGARCQ